ncbi:MAG: LysR substrate-binding domain-containing protein [Xanthobacteraceae bacterium]
MNDHLVALRLFARVARRGSLSAAGRELGIPQSTVSRAIATLERRIGAVLLVRNTRAVKLTDAGTDFLARVEPVLAELEDAEQAVRGTGELRGVLRVSLGSSLAVREVIPRLPGFLERHPALQVDLLLADHRQDLVTEGIDVALRFGPLADSTATVRHIRAWPRVLAASPAYLMKAGQPCTPADLSAHVIVIGPVSTTANWSFRNGGTSTSVRVDGRVRIAGNEGAIAAAVAGIGIVMTSSGSLRREFGEGSLVRVLEDWDLGTMELSAVFAGGRTTKRAARVFADFMVEALRNI